MDSAALDQIRKHTFLAEFCEPLPQLIDAGAQDISHSISRLGELLDSHLQQPISLRLHIIGDAMRYWRLQVGPQGWNMSSETVEAEKAGQSDIEIITSEETWRRIAEGAISPMLAMIAGQLRFRGDVVLARDVVQELRRTSAA